MSTRPGWVEAVLVILAALLLALALGTSSGCAVVGKLASAALDVATSCGRAPQVERAARAALDENDAGARLDELAESAGLEVVKCAVEWLLRSLTGAAQADGEFGARSSETTAIRPDLQPQVDRAVDWVTRRGGRR